MELNSIFEMEHESEDLNEFEVIVFHVGNVALAINVLKVREIIKPISITETPNRHHFVEGVIQLRDEAVPVIHMSKVLDFELLPESADNKMIIVEINDLVMALYVDDIDQIYRMNWSTVHNADEISSGMDAHATGFMKIENESVLLLDYEKMIMDIVAEYAGNHDHIDSLDERGGKHLLVIEDSKTMSDRLQAVLDHSGYVQTTYFTEGQAAWNFLQTDEGERINVIITDLEMPGITGHQLTKFCRDHERFKDLPIILFSAIMSENVIERNEEVGVTSQVSKPDYKKLVQQIDQAVNI